VEVPTPSAERAAYTWYSLGRGALLVWSKWGRCSSQSSGGTIAQPTYSSRPRSASYTWILIIGEAWRSSVAWKHSVW